MPKNQKTTARSKDRPYVICHMVTSIDGKILPDRWVGIPGSRGAGDLFETTAATFGIGAWLVGTTTMKEFAGRNVRLPSVKSPVPPGDFIARPGAKTLAIGTDAKGVLRFQESEVDGDHVVLLITEQVGDDYREHLRRAGVSYLICGRDSVDLNVALRRLRKEFKLQQLMLQGGGTFNGAVLRAGLVDEISQVILPIVDGGGPKITGVFDAPGEPARKAAAALRVVSQKKLPGGAQWFRFKLVRKT